MGKRLLQQRRGKGNIRWRVPKKFKFSVNYPSMFSYKDTIGGQVLELVHDSTKSAPLAKVLLEDFSEIFIIAPQNLRVGQWIEIGANAAIKEGNILPLEKIPEGTQIYNIELQPGDGGKIVRASGTFAQVVSQEKRVGLTYLLLPSKKIISVNNKSRATIGKISGFGRTEKPFTSAGEAYYKYKVKNKLYPIVKGVAMNPMEHPHGGGSHKHVGRPKTISRTAPPGRKVGSISAKKTGRKKR